MFLCNNQLNKAQLHAVEKLSALCQSVDGGLPVLYRHLLLQKRISENNVLYFQDEQLIGFLSVYFFYATACEVSVMVAPGHRREGIARGLLQTIMPLLLAKQTNSLIFSTAPTINDTWLSQLGFFYRNSDYHMQRNSYEPIFLAKQVLDIRKATAADIPDLCALDALCFTVEADNMPMRFAHLLDDNEYTLLLALYHEKIIGKAHIRWQPNGAILSDIAIAPTHQNQGFGSELLVYCINHALTLGKTQLALDVETSNQSALNLYKRHGFNVVNANDYWAIARDKLQVLLQ